MSCDQLVITGNSSGHFGSALTLCADSVSCHLCCIWVPFKWQKPHCPKFKKLNAQLDTLQVILGTTFTGQMTQPTLLKHWRKPVGHWDMFQSHQIHSTVLQCEPRLPLIGWAQCKGPSVTQTQSAVSVSCLENHATSKCCNLHDTVVTRATRWYSLLTNIINQMKPWRSRDTKPTSF